MKRSGCLGLIRSMGWGGCIVLSASCSIFAPIQTPDDDRRFPLVSQRAESVPCVDATGASMQCSVALNDTIDSFNGGLGRALWEMDLRRRQLVAQAAAHTNLNSSYNALLWPLGAFFLAKKIHDPGWSTLDTAAIATATYGLLGSGIPERDKLYLNTATRLACSMVEADADLYLRSEIQSHARDGGDGCCTGAAQTLAKRLDQLDCRLTGFIAKRDEVLTGMTFKSHTPGPVGKSAAEKARLSALGLGGAGKARVDPSDAFKLATDKLIAEAQASLSQGERLKQQLDDAGKRLRMQRSAIEMALAQGLNDRTPELVSPQARGREISQALAEGVASGNALADKVKAQSGSGRIEDWFPSAAQRADLSEASSRDLLMLWNGQRTALMNSMTGLGNWRALHDQRVATARADAAAMGCNDGTLADFAALLRKVSETAAAAAAPAAKASGSAR